MQVFESIPKKWGNSIGITLPRDIVKNEHISLNKKIKLLIIPKKNMLDDVFGTLKIKKPTQKIMDEIDKGWE